MARVAGEIPNIREQQNSDIEDRESEGRERRSDDHPAQRRGPDQRGCNLGGVLYVGLGSGKEVLKWIGIQKVRDWQSTRMSHEGDRVREPCGIDRSKGAQWKQERLAESSRIEP